MKKLSLSIAFAMLAALTIVSCKNKSQEPSQEEVLEMKQVLADSVLAEIDDFADGYVTVSENGFHFGNLELTDNEKIVKPDYLLEPSEANSFVTKSQKINALAFFIIELGVREIYGMPAEEAKEAIAKLALDVNYPFDIDKFETKGFLSESLKEEYEKCKEQGDIVTFWKFQCALVFHTDYIIAMNPDLYISKISEDELQQFNLMLEYINNAATELAPYDNEMKALLKEIKNWDLLEEQSDWDEAFESGSSTAQFYIGNKKAIIERRNRMIMGKPQELNS